MKDRFERARYFLYSEGRLLERLLFAVAFEGMPPDAIGHLISAYQNSDGGLGHALEPDLRCPESQPLFVEIGVRALHDAGIQMKALCMSMCKFLENVSDENGFVPVILPSALDSPRASHWTEIQAPGLNPTAGICGLMHYQGVEHRWLSRATDSCCDLIVQTPPIEAHTLLSAALLAEHLPDRQTADDLAERIANALQNASFYLPDAPVTTYGLTPLHFAPAPSSMFRRFFSEDRIEAHLTDLEQRQLDDGGWPIHWDAPGQASRSEWRARWTLEALSTLVAYGRIKPTR